MVQQVGGGVVAHDVLTALRVHLGNRLVADLGFAAHNFAEVDDHPRGRLAHIFDADLPALGSVVG